MALSCKVGTGSPTPVPNRFSVIVPLCAPWEFWFFNKIRMTPTTPRNTSLQLGPRDILPALIFLLVAFLTWSFMHGADRFLAMTPAALGKYFPFRWILIAHITAGGGALLTGLLQFWPPLRNFSRRLHRAIGFVYLVAILVSSSCALVLAFTTSTAAGWSYAFSLQVWVSIWISSTVMAWRAALRADYRLHREWMTRSYLVTLAFIISGLALKLPAIARFGDFSDVAPSLFWAGWALPLFIYQMILAFKGR